MEAKTKKPPVQNCKWYDVFRARIQKKEVLNPYTRQRESITIGWQLVEKQEMSAFIEPHLAVEHNSFAIGWESYGPGNFYAEKDKYQVGETIPYKTWADEQGIDPSNDLNQLLTK